MSLLDNFDMLCCSSEVDEKGFVAFRIARDGSRIYGLDDRRRKVLLSETFNGMPACMYLSRKLKVSEGPAFARKYHTKAYSGGRTEVIRDSCDKAIHIDISSLYPSILAYQGIPDPASCVCMPNIEYDGFTECTIEVPEIEHGPLPVMFGATALTSWYYPTGTFRGIWTNAEISCSVEHGCRIISVHGGVHYIKNIKPTQLIERLYQERFVSEGARKKLLKTVLNSGLGFYDRNPIVFWLVREDYRCLLPKGAEVMSTRLVLHDVPGKWLRVKVVNPDKRNGVFRHTVGLANVRMFHDMYKCGSNVCYVDTDAIINKGVTVPFPLGSQRLGHYRLESVGAYKGFGRKRYIMNGRAVIAGYNVTENTPIIGDRLKVSEREFVRLSDVVSSRNNGVPWRFSELESIFKRRQYAAFKKA